MGAQDHNSEQWFHMAFIAQLNQDRLRSCFSGIIDYCLVLFSSTMVLNVTVTDALSTTFLCFGADLI